MKFDRLIRFIIFIIVSFLTLTSCKESNSRLRSVKFIVTLKTKAKSKNVFLTGAGNILGNWKPDAIQMEKQSDSIWTKILSFKEGEKIEFNFTGGTTWQRSLDSTDLLRKLISVGESYLERNHDRSEIQTGNCRQVCKL